MDKTLVFKDTKVLQIMARVKLILKLQTVTRSVWLNKTLVLKTRRYCRVHNA